MISKEDYKKAKKLVKQYKKENNIEEDKIKITIGTEFGCDSFMIRPDEIPDYSRRFKILSCGESNDKNWQDTGPK